MPPAEKGKDSPIVVTTQAPSEDANKNTTESGKEGNTGAAEATIASTPLPDQNSTTTAKPSVDQSISVTQNGNNTGQTVNTNFNFDSRKYPDRVNILETKRHKDKNTEAYVKTEYKKGDGIQDLSHESSVSNKNEDIKNSNFNYDNTSKGSEGVNVVGIIAGSIFGVILVVAIIAVVIYVMKNRDSVDEDDVRHDRSRSSRSSRKQSRTSRDRDSGGSSSSSSVTETDRRRKNNKSSKPKNNPKTSNNNNDTKNAGKKNDKRKGKSKNNMQMFEKTQDSVTSFSSRR
uniref:Syndecan domain-containing protein n=1 Tax=Strongyloides stercoralis TaxID=6248 RepID=A0A0K0ET12_STRER